MCTVFIYTVFNTLVLQFIIGSLTRRQVVIILNRDFLGNGVVVCTVVGDVQTTVAVDEGQVTIAIQTADMSRTHGNQVAVVGIVEGGRGIAEHRGGVGIDRGRTRCRVTAGKHGVMDDDACAIKTAPSRIRILITQSVKGVGRHVFSLSV